MNMYKMLDKILRKKLMLFVSMLIDLQQVCHWSGEVWLRRLYKFDPVLLLIVSLDES